MPIALENLVDKAAGCVAAHFLHQQVQRDEGQFFRCARAVGALPLGPFHLDVGVDTVAGHEILEMARTLEG